MTATAIKAARQELGRSYDEIADACGVHRQTWIKWERGERKPDRAAVQLIRSLLFLHRIGKLDNFLDSLKAT